MNENYFDEHSEASIYNELVSLEKEIRIAAEEVRTTGIQAANSKAFYDKKKHEALLHMFVEEGSPEWVGKPRTIDQRSAKYRSELAVERMAATIDERSFEVARDYLRALQGVLTSTQTRARMVRIEQPYGQ